MSIINPLFNGIYEGLEYIIKILKNDVLTLHETTKLSVSRKLNEK